ncbi:ATP-dependent endonuclease [Ruminococcus bromii]|jgi:putative ATP-dependent endonuclease of OLD family|nr:AAA family ATPase [Ruminococcus bromii]RGZ96163.1 ATP-dependent endonuclease [Ruminococcus bromii]
MAIQKIKISNFKCFKGLFEIELNKGLNILVGNNETGKSTILEAMHIALTGLYGGRNIRNELSQYLFNKEVVDSYINSVNNGTALPPPFISIEIFFDGSINPEYEGNNNSDRAYCEGLKFEISFNEKYNSEYNTLISKKNMMSIPIEYYEASWTSFARQSVTIRSIPIKSAMIDSSNYRYQNGSDVYISRIVKDLLSPEEITAVSQAHRKMKDTFIDDASIKAINARISTEASIVDGTVSLTVDLGTKNAWESSLVTQLNEVPFGYIGKGAQCIMKTELALTHKSAQESQVILLEEPESHLSFSKLNQLIKAIEEKYDKKQIIISTHSSFVANKLGLENLLLLNDHKITKITELSSTDFFKKISGYDTLRLILCKKAILVEGDSDELVVQKAYMKQHNNHLPIENGVDVISVGTSFLRFLELAVALNLKVDVVTDNDGDISAIEKKYANYIKENKKNNIKICYDEVVDTGTLKISNKPYNYNTLEPKLLKANGNNLVLFNEILGSNFKTIEELQKYMKHHKTETALAVFETDKDVVFPDYIMEAVKDE